MNEVYRIKTSPLALEANMVTGEKYRITMLTEALVRLEYSEDGEFEDRATQMVFCRDFPKTEYRVVHTDGGIEIHTSRLHLIYNEEDFTPNGLSIQVKGNLTAYHSIWRFGDEPTDLGGTARTLDEADGAIPLDHGVVSTNGFSVLDDSRSQVILDNGWVAPRKHGIKDMYFWGYGHDYKQAIADFLRLTGGTPMLPRYALGNWWSRFYKYTEKSYLELMDRFAEENLPFTVAVIDMDWHVVDVDPKYGSGWTGYTWNREFFPDPPRFLRSLHDRGMKVTLNVHPADGVQACEEMYEEMAEAMGVDYKNEDPVVCDLADPEFIEAYFKYLHHPREEEGVDFWWIDWQQGGVSKVEGLDPLWILNHYHFLDIGRNGKRPMTFSRYAGPGSQRYPVGFSGDTLITWESLDFQPYFTVNATNIGYGWWSHDIGGHMMGYRDNELTARWVQFGVFSPIMRLHSSSGEFNGKEPWRYNKETEQVMGDMLRERHRMTPYLYTMNHRTYACGLPLMIPMYYEWPEEREAYQVKNQYYFGSSLIVAPVTTPRIHALNVAKVRAWLPEGVWYDIYTGMMYDGSRMIDLYRDLESIPVLAPAGAILPFTDEISPLQTCGNPGSLHISVYSGRNGSFCLYEDDNESCGYKEGICCTTQMDYEENKETGRVVFTIGAAQGEASLIPEVRSYTIEMTGFEQDPGGNPVMVRSGEDMIEVSVSYDGQKKACIISVPPVRTSEVLEVTMDAALRADKNDVQRRCFEFLDQAEISYIVKEQLYKAVRKERPVHLILAELAAMDLEPDLYGVLAEILSARV